MIEKVIKLDKNDREILSELDQNCRQSSSKIGKKVKTSKSVVNYKIKRLEKLGLITGYRTIINYPKLGLIFFRVYINLYEYLNIEEDFIKNLEKEKIIKFSKSCGRWDIVIEFYSKSLLEFYEKFNKIILNFKESIKEYNIEIILKQKLFPRMYLKEKKEKTSLKNFIEIFDKLEKAKLDELDLKIIDILLKNSRTPVIDISSKTNKSPQLILERIKKLLKNKVILGFKADIDYNLLNYSFYRLFLELNNKEALNKIENYLISKKEVIEIATPIENNTELIFDIEIEKSRNIKEIIIDLRKNFKNEIRDYSYLSVLKEYKNNSIL